MSRSLWPLVQSERGSHSGINEQASAIDIARRRATQERNNIRNLLTLRRALDGHDRRNLALNLRITRQFDIQQGRPHPRWADSENADALGGMVQSRHLRNAHGGVLGNGIAALSRQACEGVGRRDVDDDAAANVARTVA